MVKEVEFSNVVEVLDVNQDYSNSSDQSLFVGTLSDEGVTLDVTVQVPLLPMALAQRKLFLFFGNVDFDNKVTDYIKLEETDFDYCANTSFTNQSYTFDLSRVLIIPRKVYNTGGTSEITIELYTYEANITTDYGTKTLSVPYSISSDGRYKYDKSTDGIYKLVMLDFEPWVDSRSYGVGDIVNNGGSLIVSTVDDNTSITTDATWEVATDEDIIHYSYGSTNYPPLRAIVSDMMLSRYAKYEIIKESLLSTKFKSYDDEAAYELTVLLQNLRTRAKYKLLAHKPVEALYDLQTLKLTSSKMTDTTKVHYYNITYTT